MGIKESAFNALLRKHLADYGFKIDRVESHSTAPGIPDDAWLHKPTKKSGWLEVKEEETLPKRIKYRPKQALWLQEYSEAGGICGTILHVIQNNTVILIPGRLSLIAEKSLEHAMNCSWPFSVPINKNNWAEIASAILNL